MLTATLQVSPKLSITVQAESQVGLFQELHKNQEVFGESAKCQKCGGDDIAFVVRNVEVKKGEAAYHEISCRNPQCRAKFTYGLNSDGGSLFPKRFKQDDKGNNVKDEKGWNVYKGNKGWTIYNKETKEEE